MSLNINAVIQSGIVKWPALRYDAGPRPEFRFVLYRETQNTDGQTFALSIPCCAVGATAEKLAGELDEGMFVVVTVGELVYRKRQTKHGEVSRLEILVWRVQMGDASVPNGAVAARSETAETPDPSDPEEHRPEPKARRRGYPKAALRGGFSEN
jgi:single-stranded DNA-binding protein